VANQLLEFDSSFTGQLQCDRAYKPSEGQKVKGKGNQFSLPQN